MGRQQQQQGEAPIFPTDELDGSIARLITDKKFGFIAPDDGNAIAGGAEYFFHMGDLTNAQFDKLAIGDRVRFQHEDSAKGNGRRARQVRLVERGGAAAR